MFREIRKKKNQISTEAAEQLLIQARRGVLAVNGREGYPYAIPINYYYDREAQKIYFHGARAVVFGPKLILADEPTGNLDSKNGAEVMHLLTELNHEGTTIVMVTHNEHDAKIAHRTIRLFDGQIVEEGNQ